MFKNSFGLNLSKKEVAKEIIAFMKKEPQAVYKIIIGTDSEACFDKGIDFVTAVVVHRVGNGGRYFWRRIELLEFHSFRDRIIKEVLLSLEVAKEILTELKNFSAPFFDFEIHADIGENGKSQVLIQEVLSIIRAYHFKAKTKPESYVASKVADRHV